MAAVTQYVKNFLGGVSRQTDDKKLEGQVVDILNAVPDPTYGLIKRQGSNYLWTVNKSDGTPFGEDELKDAFWFYAESETEVTDANKDSYPRKQVGDIFINPFICAIHDASVYVWDSLSGTPQTVTNNGAGYLTRPDDTFYGHGDFHSRTILDTVVICNRNIRTKMVENTTTFTKGLVGTIRLNTVSPNTDYIAVIDDTEYKYTSEAATSAEEILEGLVAAIDADFNPEAFKTSIELSRDTAFTLSVKDSETNTLMNSYQDEAANIDQLATPSKEGRLVIITQDKESEADDYYLQFTEGQWTETVEPTVDVEFDAGTMPHRLFRKDDGTWEFSEIEFTNRLVGDDDSNPIPSFIGEPIAASFYYNNRLGFLSRANVVMSVARDVFNFFGETQLSILDSDPIDLSANSTRPVDLYEVVNQPSGLMLFGTRQQFFLSAPETGVLTPTKSIIKSICSYEADKNISPLDQGQTVAFVSKTPDYSKLMMLQGQGEEVDPVVVEMSRVVTGWLPDKISAMAVSPQNSTVALSDPDSDEVFIYKYYNDGREDKMQAWVKWKMLGTVQALQLLNDMVMSVTYQGERYVVSLTSMNSLKTKGMQLSDDEFKPGGPNIDFQIRPESVVYDATTRKTKLYVPFPLLTDKTPFMVLTLPGMNPIGYASSQLELLNFQQLERSPGDDPGYYIKLSSDDLGTDATGNYFEVNGDFTEYTKDAIAVGYGYDYEVILPKFFFKLAAKNNAADYTANLTVGRAKFAVGLTGAVTFKLKAKGSDEWKDIHHVTDANYYEADTDPLVEEQLFTVPINQRNYNFQLKVTSDLPFPVSLVSMMWEGQYSPRYYRRT